MTLRSSQSSIQSATVSFDRVSDIYDATRALPPGVSEQVTNTILNIVSPTPDTKFFETGIGTGRIALPIIQKGYSYTGLDISEKMLNRHLRKIPMSFYDWLSRSDRQLRISATLNAKIRF